MLNNSLKAMFIAVAIMFSSAVPAQVQGHSFKQVVLQPKVTTSADIRAAMGAPVKRTVENGAEVLEYHFLGRVWIDRPQGTVEHPIKAYSVLVFGNVPRDIRNSLQLERMQIRVFFGSDGRLLKMDDFAVF